MKDSGGMLNHMPLWVSHCPAYRPKDCTMCLGSQCVIHVGMWLWAAIPNRLSAFFLPAEGHLGYRMP